MKLVGFLTVFAVLCVLSMGQQFRRCQKCTRSKAVQQRVSYTTSYQYSYTAYKYYTRSKQCLTSGRSCKRRWGINYCTTRYSYRTCYERAKRSYAAYGYRYRTAYRTTTVYVTESYCCQKDKTSPLMDGALRLVDGTAPYNGRLEVNYKGRFGTICDDGFDTTDGNVACHQLGFTRVTRVRQGAYYGEGTGDVLLDNIGCTSNDVHIANCSHRGWGIEDCHHGEDVGLECNRELNIHLNGGRTPFEGRVVVYQGGYWGDVCDRNWDLNDAKVVCNQLGFGNAIRATRGGVFSPGSGTLMMSNVGCVGHETAISFCTHNGWRNVGSCTHANDAGVICSGPSPTISATSVTTTSVVISIENLPQLKYIVRFSINWYKVQYNLADGTGVTMFNIVQPRDSITVDNLVPGKTYVFKVAYVARRNNIPANSTGPFSNSITITTIISVPGHVNTFSGYTIDMETIHISWAPPTVSHGNLVGYYLEYQGNQVDSDNPSPLSVHIPSSSTSYELHGLYSDTLYNLTLHAENEVGRSEGVSIWLKTYKHECNEVDN